MIIVKCVVLYMLRAGIYMYVHGDKMDLLFHLYGEKHRGGGSGYQSVEGTMLFLFVKQSLRNGTLIFSPTNGVFCFSFC